MIDALTTAKDLHVAYVEDGAADATVLAEYPDVNGRLTNPIADEVKAIVKLRSRALSLLIKHLDDTRPTSATVRSGGYMNLSGKSVQVLVGYICLDILMNIVGTNNKLIYSDQERGGFGSEVSDGYFFRPDDYRVVGSLFVERPIVRIVKRNWSAALRTNKIRYDYRIPW